jgi:hypothetical protein
MVHAVAAAAHRMLANSNRRSAHFHHDEGEIVVLLGVEDPVLHLGGILALPTLVRKPIARRRDFSAERPSTGG